MEALDKLAVVSKTEEFNQSVHVASELRESIISNQVTKPAGPSDQISSTLKKEQILLVLQLHSALSVLQALVLDHALELVPVIGGQTLQRVTTVSALLHEQIAGLQADFANSEHKHEIIKESITGDKLTIITTQENISDAFDEPVTLHKEVAVSKEQATEINTEPVTSPAIKLENVIVLQAESHLNTITKLEDEIKDSATTDNEVIFVAPNIGNFMLSFSFALILLRVVD